jgi:hypothetical protein
MNIAIAGGSGFLGRALTARLLADGHLVSILTRSRQDGAAVGEPRSRSSATRVEWLPDGTAGPWAAALDGIDAVVNLAGESIGARRWSDAEKERIRSSRLLATRSLVSAIEAAAKPPHVLVSASAQGYYGSRGDEVLTEDASPGGDFLAGVCVAWEGEARAARRFVNRLVLVRSGLVLDRSEGALPRILAPFRMFAGGPVGSGRQFVSWIHRDDWAELVVWVLLNEMVDGPVNATSPTPVRNAEFARALGRVLGRPSLTPAPALAVRMMFGEMAESLVLSSQCVVPAKATALGFPFRFPDLEAALRDVLRSA